MSLEKARLVEIEWSSKGPAQPKKNGKIVQVQFNPASLQVGYSNQIKSGDQGNASAMQYVGKGDSKLSVELIFDVSGTDSTHDRDVRRITQRVAYFMGTKEVVSTAATAGATGAAAGAAAGVGGKAAQKPSFQVPGLRFQWGSFLFDGVLLSMSENLELWSEAGNPLRSVVSLSMSQPGIQFEFTSGLSSNIDTVQSKLQAGIRPLVSAVQGASLQSLVTRAGRTDWKNIAASNGIENPRNLIPGELIDFGP